MMRFLPAIALLGLLAGCGLGETAATTATIAESKAQEVKAGKALEARVQQQLEDARRTAEEQRKAAEAAGE